MTVASTKSYVVYTGDGATTTYALSSGGSPILYEETSDFLVYLDGVLKTETTHYTINTGTDILTFVTAPTDGADIWILRMTPRTQELDLTTNGEFDPEAVEAALDKVTREVQDAYREAEHAWQSEYGVVPGTITAGAEDTVAKFDANGNLIEGPSAAQIAESESYAEYAEEWANKDEDSLVSTDAGGDGVDDYSSKHFSIKAGEQASYAEEWAQSADLISVEAGGDGSTDRSAKYWAGYAESIAGDAVLGVDLASTDNGKGASLVGIEDAGEYYNATTVEGALAEIAPAQDRIELAARTEDRVYLVESGRAGRFDKVESDISTFVAADVSQGCYVAFSTDVTGASGGYVRQNDDYPKYDFNWFAGAGAVEVTAASDKSEALQSFIDLVSLFGSSLSGATLAVSGWHAIDTVVTKTFGKETHISIVGTGQLVSGFCSDVGVLDLNSGALRTSSLHLADLGFVPMADGAGDAIVFNNNSGGQQDQRLFSCKSCHFGPLDDTTAHVWNNHIKATCFRPIIETCFFTRGSASTTKSGKIIDFSDCYGFEVLNSYVKGSADYGVYSDGTGEEKSRIYGNTIVGSDVGIYIERSTQEPEHYIQANHINCATANVILDGAKHVWINDNLFHADLATGTHRDIDLRSASGVEIGGNTYRNTGSGANRTHVYMAPAASAHSGSVSHVIVEPNELLRAVATRYVYIAADVTDVEVNEPIRLPASATVSYPDDLTYLANSGNARIVINNPSEATWTPVLTFGGGSTGMTGTLTGKYKVFDRRLVGYASITLTAKGSSTGNASITLPANVNKLGTLRPQGNIGKTLASFASGTSGLTSVVIGRVVSSSELRLLDMAAGGITNLDDTNFTNTTVMIVNFDLDLA